MFVTIAPLVLAITMSVCFILLCTIAFLMCRAGERDMRAASAHREHYAAMTRRIGAERAALDRRIAIQVKAREARYARK